MADEDRLTRSRPVPAQALGLLPVRIRDEGRAMHLGEGRAAQDLALATLQRRIGPELLPDPPPEVLERGPQAAVGDEDVRGHVACHGRRVVVVSSVVADGLPCHLSFVGIPDRVGHPQRIQHRRAHVLRERSAGDPLDDVPEQLEGQVGVLVVDLRRGHDPREVEDPQQLLGPVQPHPFKVLPRHLALEAGCVHEEPPDRQVLDGTERILDRRELRHVANRRIVEAKQSLVPELHDRRGGDRLADRGDPVEGPLIRSPPGREIGEAGGVPPAEPVPCRQAGGDTG